MEMTFLDLRCREVVNIVDGRQLGHIIDMVIDLSNCSISGILVPGDRGFWNLIKPADPLFIPISQVIKIGEDSILVELTGTATPISVFTLSHNKK